MTGTVDQAQLKAHKSGQLHSHVHQITDELGGKDLLALDQVEKSKILTTESRELLS